MPITNVTVPVSRTDSCVTLIFKVKLALHNNKESMQLINTFVYDTKWMKNRDEVVEYCERLVTIVYEN